MLEQLVNIVRSVGNCLQSPLLLLIRLYWGYQFAITGFGKFLHLSDIAAYFLSLGIPFPHFNAVLVGCIEFFGGILLFLGLFSRVAAIPMFCTLFVALLTAEPNALISLFKSFDPTAFFSSTPFPFMCAVVIVFCFGPGKLSLDSKIGGFRNNKEMP